jgi:hypothetical protein
MTILMMHCMRKRNKDVAVAKTLQYLQQCGESELKLS